MATDMGRGIMAPDSNDPISTTGVNEMRTLGATTASAISSLDTRVEGELAERVKRDEAEQYGFEGPRGPQGPEGPPGEGEPGPQGPGGSIALEETDPGCFVDSEITWMQWPESGGLPSVWNPNTQQHEQPIRVDTSVGTRVFVGNTMIHGDTGTRELFNPSTPPEWGEIAPGNFISVHREGSTVFFTLRGFRMGDFTDIEPNPTILTLPNGFRPATSQSNVKFVNRDSANTRDLEISFYSSGAVILDRPNTQSSGRHYGQVAFDTIDPWPTNLPGSPR